MATLYANFLAGTITDNPLSNVATTINSANFANLPVVSGSDIMYLVLDPDAVDGAPEIVTVTAHTASSTSVTVTRETQSTTKRQHASGTTWRAAFTKADADQLAAIIADGAIDTANLADDAVTTAKIDAGAVDTTELADGAVTAVKLGDRSEFTATQQASTITGGTPITFDVEVQDDLGVGSAGTSFWTIPSTGIYRISVLYELQGAGTLTEGLLEVVGGTNLSLPARLIKNTGNYKYGVSYTTFFVSGVTLRFTAYTSTTVNIDYTFVIQKIG